MNVLKNFSIDKNYFQMTLQALEISKFYGKNQVLNNINLTLHNGKIYGLLGPNGAGKTTLLRIINKIILQDKGIVLWNQKPLSFAHLKQIGYLPEERGLYKKMKVGEHCLYIARLKGLSYYEAQKQIKFWFHKLDISNWHNRSIEELSKGMQQKVQFIITVLHNPNVLILDEPFSGFDPINADLIKNEIIQMKKEGKAIILSTHNMSSVEELCDSILLINKGKTVLQGNLREVKEKFKKNIVELIISECKTDLNALQNEGYKLFIESIDNEHQILRINIPSEKTSNDLLYKLIPICRIHSFYEVLPTINEIFIHQIKPNENN